MKTTTNHTQIGATNQAVTYRELLTLAGTKKLQIEIRSDGHSPQSYATIELHDGKAWNRLGSIPPSEMKTEHGLAYKQGNPTKAAFENDRNTLIQIAAFIIGDGTGPEYGGPR